MSKTETQSEAQKLSALLNVAMAFDHGRIGTDRRFVEMDATVVASVDSELRRLDAENKALRARLEIDPSHPIDGIAARDETIRQLEAQVKSAAEAVKWPKDAKEVREFFASDFISATFAREDQVPCDDDRYFIAAHDFLSAIDWWADFPNGPRAPQAAAKTGDAA